ncbi:MAG: PTS sugar transporter subunit IIC [Coprobacillaceae bacterium]
MNENRFVDKLVEVAGKVSTQRHVKAIRDAFSTAIPVTIVSAVFLVINYVVIGQIDGLGDTAFGQFIAQVGNQVSIGTLNILGLLITFLIGYYLAKTYGYEGVLEGVMAVVCFVTLAPSTVNFVAENGTEITEWGVLTSQTTGSSAMLIGVIAALVSTTVLCKLSDIKKLQISMPDSVPPGVAKAFNGLFPSIIVVTLFAVVEVATRTLTGNTITEVIVNVLQTPLKGGFQSLPGILLYVFLATFVFVFGIHGAFVFGAISGPILLQATTENIAAIEAGLKAPNIVTQSFLDVYVYMGGGGTMICLVIALFIASRRPDEKMVAKLGSVPSLFNISEPIMFGLPVVYNPIYAIPFCIVPILSTLIGYFATSLGLVAPTYIMIPWVTPPLLSGYLSTGDIRGTLVQLVIIVVGVLVYLPFVFASNKAYKKEQSQIAE